LIVNADDFGLSDGINEGIAKAHEHGIVTSASLMVRWPAARQAAAYGRAHPDLSLGLHIDLRESAYRMDSWEWVPVYEFDVHDSKAVEKEIKRQLDVFRRFVGDDPTHVDSHQHVHHYEPVHSLVRELAEELQLPLRHYTPSVQYSGDFYGQTPKGTPYHEAITVEALISILADLPPGLTELGCHPGDASDVDTSYRAERALEVEVLCNARIRETLDAEQIELRSFHGLGGR